MEEIYPPNFWGGSGKVEPLTPNISKMGGPGGSNFFVQLGPLSAQKILASGPPVKGGRENNFGLKKFLGN